MDPLWIGPVTALVACAGLGALWRQVRSLQAMPAEILEELARLQDLEVRWLAWKEAAEAVLSSVESKRRRIQAHIPQPAANGEQEPEAETREAILKRVRDVTGILT